MAMALNSLIPHTRALSLSTSFPSSPHKKPSTPQFPYPQSRRSATQIVQNAASSSMKTTLFDIEHQLHEDRSTSFNPASTSASAWSEFARNVSGEWDGYGADFTLEGNPIELPEMVVPDAYREWEVKVFDWQTQCPTLADPENQVLAYKTIELLPTVGCEADAATRYNILERNVGGVESKVSAFAYQSSGCYVSVLPVEDKSSTKLLELEYCLINPQDKESRVRIIQDIRIDDTKMILQSLRVLCEQWYGPFRNGEQLGGCAIRDSAFAATPSLDASKVVGTWRSSRAVAKFSGSQDNFLSEVIGESEQNTVRDENGLILLPKKMWCSVKEGNDGDTYSEVGWLLDQGLAITSRCTFSSAATLKEISVASETVAGRTDSILLQS